MNQVVHNSRGNIIDMGIITKGMGAIMKAKMKKAGVTKPTFPGPRVSELLNKELKKSKLRGSDKVETASRIHKDMKCTGENTWS